MRTLHQLRYADVRDQQIIESLRKLHTAPVSPMKAIEARDLQLPPDITEEEVLSAARSLNQNCAPSPNRMSRRFLRLLAQRRALKLG